MGLISLLIVFGIVLVIAELLLIPGGIITGLLGIASLVASCFIAFTDYGTFAGVITIIITICALTALTVFVLREKTWQKATLNTEINARVDVNPAQKGIEPGLKGVCTTRLNPIGRVLFDNGIELEAHSLSGLLDTGNEIVVARVEAEKVFVKKINVE